MSIINCTPHVLSIVRADGSVLILAPSGVVPRVSATQTPVNDVDGITVTVTTYGDVVDLPPLLPGVWRVVSRMVLSVSGRCDLLAPGDLIRGPDGQPVGCRGLSR